MLEWADAEETVETLRRKTAEHFHGESAILCLQKHAEIITVPIVNMYFMLLTFHASGLQEAAKGRGYGENTGDYGDYGN